MSSDRLLPPEQNRQTNAQDVQAQPPLQTGDSGRAAMAAAQEHNGENLSLLELGGKAFIRSAIQEPLKGLTQLADQIPGVNIKQPQVDELPQAKFGSGAWFAETLGSGLGMVAPFVVTEKLTGLATGGRIAGPWKAAMDGSIYGFVLTPSNDPSHNFFEQRLYNAAASGITFGTQNYIAGKVLGAAGYMENPAVARSLPGFFTRAGANAFSGAIAGGVNAEATSLLYNHQAASAEQVRDSVGAFLVTGFGLDALHFAGERYSDWRASRKAPGGTAESLPLSSAVPESRTIGARFNFPAGDLSRGTGSIATSPIDPFTYELPLRAADMPRPMRIDTAVETFSRRRVPAEVTAEIRQSAEQLRQDLEAHIGKINEPGLQAAQREDANRLIADAIARRRDLADPRELIEGFNAVRDFVRAPQWQVDFQGWQVTAAAKQMLQLIAEPRLVNQGADNTCGPASVQEVALLNKPGKQVRAIVDILTTGKHTVVGEGGGTVDLSRETLQALDQAADGRGLFASMLHPDSQALATLEQAGRPGMPATMGGARGYVDQVAQLVNGNIRSQLMAPEGERAIYVKGRSNPLIGDTGERLFYMDGEKQWQPVLGADGKPRIGPGMEARDIQPIYDLLTGDDSSRRNFVLLHTKEELSPEQGTRFLSSRELERLLLKGGRPMVVEVDPLHPLFNRGVDFRGSFADGAAPARHVVLVEPARHPETGELLMREGRPLFNVIDTCGATHDLVGERAVTARELFDATRHPDDPHRIEPPRRIPGVDNFGWVDDFVARGRRPESYRGIKTLKDEGVTLIIDLIENPVMRGNKPREEYWANRAGIKYVNMKTSVKNFDSQQIQRVLEAIDAEIHPTDGRPPGKVFIHCARGADRTGAIVAFYRVKNGWSAREAQAEMREYNWSEKMYYGSRMGSMVAQVAPELHAGSAEARDIGAARVPFHEMDMQARIDLLEEAKAPIFQQLAQSKNNQDSVYTLLRAILTQSGLQKAGWSVYPTAIRSPLDGVGADFLLINHVTGDAHFLDATANAEKGQAEATRKNRQDPTKVVPALRRPGVIHFSHQYFDFGKLDVSNPEAVQWARDVAAQVKDLTSQPAPFNLNDTPLPDPLPVPMEMREQQLRTFVDWLKEQRKPDYDEYAQQIEGAALRHAHREATMFDSPPFREQAQRAAQDAMLSWAIREMTRGRSGTPQNNRGEPQSKVFVQHNSYDPRQSVLRMETSDDRVAHAGYITEIMDAARLGLSKPGVTVKDAELRLERATTERARNEAEAQLRQARYYEKVLKRLESAGLRGSDLEDFLMRNQGMIRQGGPARGGGPATNSDREITHRMLELLRMRREGVLLGEEEPEQPQPRAKKNRAEAPADPYADLKPFAETTRQGLAELEITRDSQPQDVADALELVAEAAEFEPPVVAQYQQLAQAYLQGDAAAVKTVNDLLADAPR